MGITKTVGGAGRDYDRANYGNDDDATLQAAISFFDGYDFASNGGGPCYIDIYKEGGGTDNEWVLGSSLTGPVGATNVSASNYLVFRAVAGSSFKDHANKLTNPLRYNPAVGVAIRQSATANLYTVGQNFTRFVGLQFKTGPSGANGLASLSGVGTFRVENCIVQGGGGGGVLVYNTAFGVVELYNSLFYNGYVNVNFNGNDKVVGNTFYFAGDASNRGALWLQYGAGLVVDNIAFSDSGSVNDIRTSDGASFSAGSGYCAVNDTSGPTTGAVTGVTMSDVFESLTGGSEDFRIKNTAPSTVRQGGTRRQAETADLDIVGSSRSTSTPTIGAWENQGAVTSTGSSSAALGGVTGSASGYLAQIVAPVSDGSAGAWQSTGANLFSTLDEFPANDADYIFTFTKNSPCRIKLGALGDPNSSVGHKIFYRLRGDGTANMVVRLYTGGTGTAGSGTLVKTWTHSPAPASLTDYEQTLSGGEADSITDYANLYLEFEAT